MSTVLVTGGAGYIGSHACKRLAEAGHVPVTYDNLSTGWSDAVKFGPFEQGDLLDRPRLDEVFARHKPQAVMHFAALSDVGQSMRAPALYWRNNVVGSMTLLDAATAAGTPHFVFSSTCATYGEQDGVMLDETCVQQPINAYGGSKRAVEDMLRDYGRDGRLTHVTFRYFNVAGADPDRQVGEFHRPETHLIPLALDAVRGRRDALTIYGTDYATPDGTCIRDYVHVLDLVDAHLKGLEYLIAGGGSEVFNLGTGRGFSVREVIDAVSAVTETTVPAVEGARRPGDCTALVSGSRRAEQVLGWTPRRSTLPQMIADAWGWHQMPGYTA
ncbi:UDP-glucose 4-epimerase GalE [Halovulum dunhuangense]|uniref:UDP-glucose 4-epimerase n=1 Tax=Halovulum dunhuangense TaxID=1505036 RepID=A0A849KUJ6_9RHOB|nr:UDP-glucose 4-epimerase GalE [Halovulum dunhuangense]NNU78978.1 UDP-glucose 4-epimerase GalE [Halovulum dunhuangense]